MREPNFSCVIFDLDGTLADTAGAIAQTIRTAIAEAGYPAPSQEAALSTVGRPLDEAFRALIPAHGWAQVPACITAYRELYDRAVVPATVLFPGVPETLEACRVAGLRLAVATTKLTRIALTTLRHCGIAERFDVIAGGDRASRPKPDPGLALAVLEELACPAGQALMVGDTTYDIEMGRAAGTRTCAVTYGGVHSRARLATTGPDYMIDSFGDLAGVLGLGA